jgi:hypothetical protein
MTTPKVPENKEWLKRNEEAMAAKNNEFVQKARSTNA